MTLKEGDWIVHDTHNTAQVAKVVRLTGKTAFVKRYDASVYEHRVPIRDVRAWGDDTQKLEKAAARINSAKAEAQRRIIAAECYADSETNRIARECME